MSTFSGLLGARSAPNIAAFKRWFKASKVVNPDGTPKVVYHGTTSDRPFSVFQPHPDPERTSVGFHFGTLAQAVDRAVGIRPEQPGYQQRVQALLAQGKVFPVYLSLQNPMRVKDLFDWSVDSVVEMLRKRRVVTRAAAERIFKLADDGQVKALYALMELLDEKGVDGFVYANEIEGGGVEDSYAVLHPQQVKSADRNRGTFDSTDPSMLNGVA